jgi:UPF0271 protein
MLSRDLKDKNKQLAADPDRTVWLNDGLLRIDLNCDMGEGMDNDALLMPNISSANIACGYHAGDEATMRRTIELALEHGVAVGAHPSYPDRENFGRLDLLDSGTGGKGLVPPVTLENIPAIITDQLGSLQKVCARSGARLHHVKLHGALYNRAARDTELSMLVCQAIKEFDPSLLLYGPGGSAMQEAALHFSIFFVKEAFADRTYQEDGSLTPRTAPHALIGDPDQAIRQVLKIIREGRVLTTGGKEISLTAETICIHGDSPQAMQFAPAIRQALEKEYIAIQAP